jgi:hypothetical protein
VAEKGKRVEEKLKKMLESLFSIFRSVGSDAVRRHFVPRREREKKSLKNREKN